MSRPNRSSALRAKRTPIGQWLNPVFRSTAPQPQQDIGAAEACLQVDLDGLADPIGYSSYQACEKALKALLPYHGVGAPRTHDLPILLQLCLQFAPSLAPIESRLFLPKQFGIDGRYPQADHPVAMDEAIAALDAARALVREVCSLMGTPT